MRSMGIADDQDRRLGRIVLFAASTVLEETRRAPAFLFERIGAVVALIKTLHQTFSLRAVDVEIENARNQGRKAPGKALGVVCNAPDDTGRSQHRCQRERNREGAAAKRRRDRRLNQPVGERRETDRDHRQPEHHRGRRNDAGPDMGKCEERPVPEVERIGNDAKKAGDAIAERDVADQRTWMRDHQRAAGGRDHGPPAREWLRLAHEKKRAEHQRDAERGANIGDAAARIRQGLEQKDLAIGDQRAERELPCAGPRKIEGGDRVDRRQDHAGG